MQDVIIIGAGPCGLSAAIECQKRGLHVLVLEKHCIVHSIYSYPTNMQFFSTPELLEIGDIPFSTPNEKPFRHEALAYYRNVSRHFGLHIASYEEATQIIPQTDETFIVHSKTRKGESWEYRAKNVIISTGYFDHPNMLGIPGENLEHVTHYFHEAHPYSGTKVVVIGGSNSAVDAALELMRVDAEVTMVYRRDTISEQIKPWVRPIFDSMVNKGKINLKLSSRVIEIHPDYVVVDSAQGQEKIQSDFVLALTGFRPDRKLLEQAGVQLTDDGDKPLFDPHTMQTNVPGLYVAGVIASGSNANEVFIETGRMHGVLIADHIISTRNKE